MLIFKCLAADRFCLQNPPEKYRGFSAKSVFIIKSNRTYT